MVSERVPIFVWRVRAYVCVSPPSAPPGIKMFPHAWPLVVCQQRSRSAANDAATRRRIVACVHLWPCWTQWPVQRCHQVQRVA